MHGMPTVAEAKAAAEALAQKAPVPQPAQQPKANAGGNGKRARRSLESLFQSDGSACARCRPMCGPLQTATP
jgi:hypothetical protein